MLLVLSRTTVAENCGSGFPKLLQAAKMQPLRCGLGASTIPTFLLTLQQVDPSSATPLASDWHQRTIFDSLDPSAHSRTILQLR
jgi:hypothetical protein